MGKKSAKHVEQEIRQAINDLPSLLFKQQDSPPIKKSLHTRVTDSDYHQGQKKKKILVGIGVAIVTITVVILWISNIESFVDKTIEESITKTTILQEQTKTLKQVIEGEITDKTEQNSIETLLQKTNTIDSIKQTLTALVSKSASSTEDISTTTKDIITSSTPPITTEPSTSSTTENTTASSTEQQ